MKDNGWVVSTKDRFARVKVRCFSSCEGCAAQSLCHKEDQSMGFLTVINSAQAHPGDKVQVYIPESFYSRSLIFIFGSLLLSALIGMFIGYACSTFLPVSSSPASLGGLFLGILLAGLWNARYLRKKKQLLYPIIMEIINKGAHHGST